MATCKSVHSRRLGLNFITRKRGNCECIATRGRTTPRQFFSALTTTPCQVWSRWTLPYYSVLLLIHYFMLWPWPLTRWPWKFRDTSSYTWSKYVRNLNEIEQCPVELLRIFAQVVSRSDLDLWPLDLELLQHFGCPAFKLCTKFKRNRIIHGWDIDDLARFCVQF